MNEVISKQAVIDLLLSEPMNEPRYPDWWARKVADLKGLKVAYFCNGKMCGTCNYPDCQLTTDIEYAMTLDNVIVI